MRRRRARVRTTLVLDGEDLHRNVARLWVTLQLIQYRPAQHVRQEYIERDGGRRVLANQRQGVRTGARQQYLEAAGTSQVDQDARIVRVVLYHEQDGVLRLQHLAVIGDLLGAHFR